MRTVGVDLSAEAKGAGMAVMDWDTGGGRLNEVTVGADDIRRILIFLLACGVLGGLIGYQFASLASPDEATSLSEVTATAPENEPPATQATVGGASRAMYGHHWPLTVEEAVMHCDVPADAPTAKLVTMDAAGKTYAVNGTARSAATARGWTPTSGQTIRKSQETKKDIGILSGIG